MKALINYIIYWAYYLTYQWEIRFSDGKKYFPDDISKIERYTLKKAMLFALKTHHGVRQKYDKKYPYFYHLVMVYRMAWTFKYCLPEGRDRMVALLAALFHDLIEDCRLTYNDVKNEWGEDVADAVFACTELRGKNRAERHGPEFYAMLREKLVWAFVKACDKAANMRQGVKTRSSMLGKNRKEYKHFKEMLWTAEMKDIFEYIETHLMEDKFDKVKI